MTGRERVVAALNHKISDRTPIDFGGHRSSGIMAIAYNKLKKALGISTGDIYVYDMVQQLAIIEEPVLDALGIDTVEMGRGFLTDAKDWKDWVLPDGTPCKIPFYINVQKKGDDWLLFGADGTELGIQKKGCLYFEQTTFPMETVDFEHADFSDLRSQLGRTIWAGIPHPGAHLPLEEKGLREMTTRVKALRESTSRAVIGLFGGNLFEFPQWLFRMDNYLMYMGLYPEKVEEFTEALYKIHLANLEKWMGAVGPYIDVVVFGDDLGSQCGPLVSPEMYRTFIKPYHAKLWRRAKELAPVKVNLHSCGGIEPLLGDMIDAGLDAVNPVQITCADMDAGHLKSRYGKDLVFWGGGCDTRKILPTGTPDQIQAHVRKQKEIFGKGGGFVFQQVHNIMADVPPENIIAMFKEAGAV